MSTIPEKPSVLSVIEACSIFNALGDSELNKLSNSAFTAYAERGEYIWLAGSPAHNIAIVGTGFVKMTRTTAHGSEIAIELLGPGQCLGLLVAIEGREYPLAAVAVTNTWYLKIPTPTLMEIYSSNEFLRDHIVRSIAPRLRKAHDMMARMSTGKVEQRIAAVLLILADSYGETEVRGTRITVPLTRQDLAEMAGTTVETAIRVMTKLQRGGSIMTDRQMITVLDQDRLSATLSE